MATSGAATAPAQFGAGDWSVAAGTVDGTIDITVTALPDSNGDPITNVEYQLNGTGAWVQTEIVLAPDTFTTGLLSTGTLYNITLRAINDIGNGTASASKSVTTGGTPSFSNPGTDDPSIAKWYDASDAAQVSVSGTNVVNIADYQTAETMIDSNNPQYNDGVIQRNGLNVIQCQNAANHSMFGSAYPWPTGDWSYHTAIYLTAFEDASSGLVGFSDNTISFTIQAGNASQFNGEISGTAVTTTSFTNGPFSGMIILQIEYDNTAGEIRVYINNVLEATAAKSSTISSPLGTWRWGRNQAGTKWTECDLCEQVLTENMSLRTEYYNYLNDKWNP